MTLGRLFYLLRRKFHGGPRVAYYREVVRPRILKTPPITNTTDLTCEIHVLTSNDDWLNLVWALKSFYHFSRRNYALCIHDDGSLDSTVLGILQQHFPQARFIERQVADAIVLPALADFPACGSLRRTNKLALKLFDFCHFLESDRLLLLDSDVLFFDHPTELLRRIEDPNYLQNTVNADVESAYTVDSATVEKLCGFSVQSCFNSGLGLIHRDSLRLDWIEEFLALPGILGHFWRIEQTLFALCSSRFGTALLPDEYSVHLGDFPVKVPCRHYVGAIRGALYGEGVALLSSKGFLSPRTSWSAHAHPNDAGLPA